MPFLAIIILMPLVGALIGWGTNYVAIKMLFHPRRPRKLIDFTLQGVIPKHRTDLAQNLGELVETELVSTDDITQVIKRTDLKDEIAQIGDRLVDGKIKSQMAAANPLLAMVPEEIFDVLKEAIKQGISDDLDVFVGSFVNQIETDVDLKNLVKNRIDSFDLDKIEDMMLSILSTEFQHIEIIGGIIGFIIGVVQIGLLLSFKGLA